MTPCFWGLGFVVFSSMNVISRAKRNGATVIRYVFYCRSFLISVTNSLDQLMVEQVSATCVISFLHHVEEVRHCTITTRNQRLAAIRALAGFVADHSPEHIAWCGDIRRIPLKKTIQPRICS